MNRPQATKINSDVSLTGANRTGRGGISMPAVPVLQQKFEYAASEKDKDERSSLATVFNPIQAQADGSANINPNTSAANNVALNTLKSFQLKAATLDEMASRKIKPFNVIQPVQKKNNSGLPGALKAGVENLSGFSMDDVKVHYNSDKPAQLKAFAYAQGADIHVARGQEKHLPHEAWHVVQQKQGRVQPTIQMKGAISLNTDPGLEKEADEMGGKSLMAAQTPDVAEKPLLQNSFSTTPPAVAQRVISYKKRGKWVNRQSLINEIVNYFKIDPEDKERILFLNQAIAEDEKNKEVEWVADKYFRDFISHAMSKWGWSPPFEKAETKDSHGPQLPVDHSVKKPSVSVVHSSENTFTFPSKTMGRAQVIHNGEVIFDIVKYSDDGVHSEHQMVEMIDAFVISKKKLKWSDLKIRITINNFPCDDHGAHCGKLISEWAKEKKMAEIHIYYANKYEGSTPNGFLNSWNYMKKCNIPINLTPFKAEEYLTTDEFGVAASMKFKPEVPKGKEADDFSDSEEESSEGGDMSMSEEEGIDVHGEVDEDIIDSVAEFIDGHDYYTDKKVFVVDGSDWTCYIRCVLHHFDKISEYDSIIKALGKVGFKITSGVTVGDDSETVIQDIIARQLGNPFYVEVTNAANGHMAVSNRKAGTKVYMLLTGAHFSLLY